MSFTSGPVTSEPPSRWRDVRIAAVARGASIGGDMMSATALLLALQGRDAGGWAVAALLIAVSAPLALLSPLTGRLVDRVDSRPLIIVIALVQAACCVAMAYAQSAVLLVALVAAVATGAAITQPTFAALIPEMVRRADLPRAAALGQTASSVGMLAGPPLAGLLVGLYGTRVPLLIDGVTFLAVAAAGMLIATRRRPTRSAPEGAHDEPPRGWTIRRDPLLLPVVAMVGLVVAAVSLVNVAEIFFVRDVLHASTTMYGVVMASWTGAMVIGSWLVARRVTDDSGYALLLTGMLAANCAVIGLGGLVPGIGWLLALWVIGGIGNGAINSLAGVLISRRTPAAVRGRAFARFGAVASAANMIGFLLGGVLVGPFTPRFLLVACGVLGVAVSMVCVLPLSRAVRRERARTVASVTPRPVEPAAA